LEIIQAMLKGNRLKQAIEFVRKST